MNEIQKFENDVYPIVEEAKTLFVSAETYEYAARLQIDIRKKRREIQDFFKPMKDKAFAAHREICNSETKVLEPLRMADGYLNPKIGGYLAEEERKRKEAEAKLQEEANKITETDALDRAEQAEKAGDHAAAEAILENESKAPPVIVASTVKKIDGLFMKNTPWKFRIISPKKIGADFLMPDEKKIGGVVRSMGKEAERLIGGIEVYREAKAQVRTK